MSSAGSCDVMPGVSWRRKELSGKRSITANVRLLEPVLTLLLTPLGWCEYEWSKRGTYESSAWAGDLWSTSPMDHQQLAMRMVCLWGLVKGVPVDQAKHLCLPTSTPCHRGLSTMTATRSWAPKNARSCSTPACCSMYPTVMMRDTRTA